MKPNLKIVNKKIKKIKQTGTLHDTSVAFDLFQSFVSELGLIRKSLEYPMKPYVTK